MNKKTIIIIVIIAAVAGYFIWKKIKTSATTKTTGTDANHQVPAANLTAREKKIIQLIPEKEKRQQLYGKAIWYEATNPTQATIKEGKVFHMATGQFDAQGRTDTWRYWMDAGAFDMYKAGILNWNQYIYVTGQSITKLEVQNTF